MQYESTVWSTANLLRGCGIKESEWPSFMMPFFALVMIESRLLRMLDEIKKTMPEKKFAEIKSRKDDFITLIRDHGQGYNKYICVESKRLADICKNDKAFEIDFDAYLNGFDGETKDLLGVDPGDGEKFLDIKGVITKLKAKKILFSYAKAWSEIDLQPFNNSEITTLEEHIKRKWADISAETAGEQYTPDDVIALIADIIASKIVDNKKLLKIYDCTCGGGNLLFGVEDRINEKFKRLTQTFGQDWNDALYALAKIESRFRADSRIEHGNTMTDDKFDTEECDVVVANPPYGVSWAGYQKDIERDKTGRFHFLPSISDGQLLFMQHLISKLAIEGMGVVVHNGSTLFSGDAGSAESNIRKWLLDTDIVEAIIQLPTDEFFNTGIYTYLWVLNKKKPFDRKDKLMLINASEKFKPLKKSKGSKRKEVDEVNREEIVAALAKFKDNDFARVFDKEHFYFNKQAIQLTNVDTEGRTIASLLEEEDKSIKLTPVSIATDTATVTEFEITEYDKKEYHDLFAYYEAKWKLWPSTINYKENPLAIATSEGSYRYDIEHETIVKTYKKEKTLLGNGCIVIKTAFKKATKTKPATIAITVELTPDYQKDYEIIPFHKDEKKNRKGIEAFMAKYITRPFEYLDNVVGVEINFNKVFYKPEKLREVKEIVKELALLEKELKKLEEGLVL
jgi:type I restriction enzyme M protein